MEQHECPSSRVCLVLIAGLPASLKSSISQLLQDFWLKENRICCHYICFDQLFHDETLRSSSMTEEMSFDNQEWRNQQKQMLLLTQNRILCEQNKETDPSNVRTVFLIDDNFYYASMRHSYYVLARDLQISFCTLFCIAELDDCIRRNEQRIGVNRVPEHVIHSMHQKFEYDSKVSSIPTMKIDTSESYLNRMRCSLNVSSIAQFIEQSFHFVPNKCTNDESSSVMISRLANQQLLHQLDLALRKRVSDIMKTLPTNSEIHDKKQLMKDTSIRLSSAKKTLYDQVKCGDILIPDGVTDQEFISLMEQQLLSNTLS